MFVLKIGGNEIDQPAFLDSFSRALRTLNRPGVIVHGGGKEIAAALGQAKLQFEMVDGIRATDREAMVVVEQVLSGTINKRLTRLLNAAGLPAIGISGVDLDLLRTVPLRPQERDLGRVGEIVAVRVEVLHSLLAQNWLPVVSPVSVDQTDHAPTNVNADHAALAIAAALQADELIFISNVPGVLLKGAVVPQLTAGEIEHEIAQGTIVGGMIPKVRAAMGALASVRSVRITNIAGLQDGGTRITSDQEQA
ncbi:MAG: acetylglutamate kinase [Herpetosiphonaceae bacterium]|nr:acetylglutamate kinase [Herpetosiphonaceae bacterium]